MKGYGSISLAEARDKHLTADTEEEDAKDNCQGQQELRYMTPDKNSKLTLPTIQKLKADLMREESHLLTESTDVTSATTGSSRNVRSDIDENGTTGSDGSSTYKVQFEDWASNICFLLGSIGFVWLAVWDIIDYDDGDNDDDDDDDGVLDASAPWFLRFLDKRCHFVVVMYNLLANDPYTLLSAISAILYVADAAFQIARLFYHHQTSANNSTSDADITQFRSPALTLLAQNQYQLINTPNAENTDGEHGTEQHRSHHHIFPYHGHIEVRELLPDRLAHGWWKRNSKVISALLIGVTFGVGASLDLASSFLVDENEDLSDALGMAANHMYLFNALLLTAPMFWSSFKSCNPRRFFKRKCHCGSEALEYTGDFLFLSGSIIDVAISYGQLESSWKSVEWFSLLSAVLWLIDAFLYIAADCIGYDEDDDDDDDDDDDENENGLGAINSDSAHNNGEMVVIVGNHESDCNDKNDLIPFEERMRQVEHI